MSILTHLTVAGTAPCAETAQVVTFPNGLTLLRVLLGVAFPWVPESWRLPVVIVAAISDLLDGPLSRLTHTGSSVGRVFDPIADKIFIGCVLLTLVCEGTLNLWQLVLLALRDIAVVLRASLVVGKRDWSTAFGFHPSVLGKLTTALQMISLAVILLAGTVPLYVLMPTAVVGGLAGLDYFIGSQAGHAAGRSQSAGRTAASAGPRARAGV